MSEPADPGTTLLFGGVVVAAPLLLTLPAALLLHARGSRWVERAAVAGDTRRTACVLVGAGTVIAALLGFAALWNAPDARALAVVWLAGAYGLFVVGFTAGAERQGRRLLRRDGGVACVVLGWLARSGAFAVPVLWPVIGAYLVSGACGAAVLGLSLRGSGKVTTDASAGSTPDR